MGMSLKALRWAYGLFEIIRRDDAPRDRPRDDAGSTRRDDLDDDIPF